MADKDIYRFFPWILAGGTLSLIAFSQFPKTQWGLITSRDQNLCQILKCRNGGFQAHHIVPECLENNHPEPHGTDNYVDPFLRMYKEVLLGIPDGIKPEFRKTVRQRIGSAENGLTICPVCHRNLHRGRLEDLTLKVSGRHLQRPNDLKPETVLGYFCATVIDPGLSDFSLPVIDKRRLAQLIENSIT